MKFLHMKMLGLTTLLMLTALTGSALSLKLTKGGHLAAINEKLLKKALIYKHENKENKLKTLKDAYLVIVLKPDIEVEVLKEEEMVKIRLMDAGLVLWTTPDALKEKPPPPPPKAQ